MNKKDTQFKPGQSGNPTSRLFSKLRELGAQEYLNNKTREQIMAEWIMNIAMTGSFIQRKWAMEFYAKNCLEPQQTKATQPEPQIKFPSNLGLQLA